MYKSLVLVLAIGASAFAQEAPRVETRSRNLGAEIMAVSKCSAPEGSSYASTVLVQNNQGELYNAPATTLKGSTSITIKKCILVEDYQVDVTGSFWNSKSSEKAGSAKQRVEIREFQEEIYNTQTIRDQKDTYLGGDNTVAVAINVLEGLKSKAKQDCEIKRSQLKQSIVQNSRCNSQQ